MHKLPQPVRLWYLSSFFRHEAPQAGRYRQFWQVGAEAIGSHDPAVDAESIILLADLLADLGAGDARLHISSLGTPASRAEYRERLQAYLREHADRLAPEVRARIDANPLRAFDAKDPDTRAVMAGAPRLLDHLDVEDLEHFAAVRTLLEEVGLVYEIDPTLVRGLDYYTRTVFAFVSDRLGAQSEVGGGGRYDGLIELLGGPPTPAIGWAAGVERMLMAGGGQPTAPPPVDLFVAYAKDQYRPMAFRLSAAARRAGLAAQVELAGRGLKGQMKHADRLGARWVAILGDEGATLKDMTSGEQREMAAEEVIPAVQRGSSL
jgi:histidyl-tRNA synthetase